MEQDIRRIIENKRVLFIATKNLDYLRIQQEIGLIKKYAGDWKIIGSNDKKYFLRIFKVFLQLFLTDMRLYDIAIVGFLPQIIIPFFSVFLGKKIVVVDFFISLYDTLVFDRKVFRPGGLAARVLKWFDQTTLKKADHIIVDTKADAEYFIRELKADRDRITVLYLEADRTIYYPRQAEKRADLKGKYVVLYFGSILPLQGVEVILECLPMLRDYEDIYFIIIGPVKQDVHENYRSLGNVEFIPWLAQEELARHIAMADLCLAGHFNKDIDKARRTIAGKTYIYRAMEKPVVLGDNPANRELFSEGQEGVYFVEMGSPERLKETILEAYREWKREKRHE